ncbi:MAG: TolC family protein [Bacteroidales bacterium]|nr:TolC family protein [Bacteroidales bacterium]
MLNNLKYAVELSQERVRIDKERFLLGSGSKMQLLQSQVYLNADSSLLVKQYEMVRASHIRLNEYLGLDSIENYFLIADTTIQLLPVPDYPALLETTLAANTSLELGRRKIEIAGFDKAIAMSRSYPYLTVSGGYGYNYYTYQSGTLQNSQNLGLNYGITLGFNIFDGFNRKREISNSIIQEEINRYEYQDIEQMVKSDLVTIYRAYENNLRLLEIEKQNLEIARENLEIALDRYKLGALSGLELREVQKSLLDAEERLLSIQYQTKLAEISLMKISGKVMEYL